MVLSFVGAGETTISSRLSNPSIKGCPFHESSNRNPGIASHCTYMGHVPISESITGSERWNELTDQAKVMSLSVAGLGTNTGTIKAGSGKGGLQRETEALLSGGLDDGQVKAILPATGVL